MMDYAKSQGVPLRVLRKTAVWLQREGFDSDAVKQDVTEQNVASHQCSIAMTLQHADYELMGRAIMAFDDETKC